jgi:hypothetical protein
LISGRTIRDRVRVDANIVSIRLSIRIQTHVMASGIAVSLDDHHRAHAQLINEEYHSARST